MRLFLLIFSLLNLPLPALAEDEPAVAFLSQEALAKEKTTIERLEKYLTSVNSIVADFSQIAPDGTLTSGKFFLERPGKMRWQYNPPTPILMVADGKSLVFYDYELEQITYIPLDSTLIGFLAQDVIRFEGTVGIVGLEKEKGITRITLVQREKPTDGSLTLEFSDAPLAIRNIVIRDATNQVTTVSLTNAQFGVVLDKKLFVFNDPRKGRRNRP